MTNDKENPAKYSSRSIGTRAKILNDFDLPEAPDEIALREGQRLVAIGDIHGNYPLLLNILLTSQLAERNDQMLDWIGTDSIVVFLGDLFDKGHDEEKCLRLICRMAQQAKLAGGTVVCLWGNHESMNTEHFFSCVANEYAFLETFAAVEAEEDDYENNENANVTPYETTMEKSLKKAKIDPIERRKKVFAHGGLLAQAFLSKLKVAVKVGRSVFVHGGLVKRHLDYFGGGMRGIVAMNDEGCKWIMSVHNQPPFLDCLDPPIGTRMDIDQGPQWMRDYSIFKDLTDDAKEKLDAVLSCLDVDRMVVGHTEQSDRGGVNSAYDEKVWRVDIGTGVPYGTNPTGRDTMLLDDSEFLYNLALQITAVDGAEKVRIVRREAKWLHN